MIDILLPSRGRPESLTRSVESLRTRATGDFEVFVAADDDDRDTQEVGRELGCKVLVFPRYGYHRLHEYVNRLAEWSTGEWKFLWNDDALMMTSKWDEKIHAHDGKAVVLNPATNHGFRLDRTAIFPIVSKTIIDRLGHFSLSPHNDTWIQDVVWPLGRLVPLPSVEIFHDQVDLTGGHDDLTSQEREYKRDEFYSQEMVALRAEDTKKLVSL